MPFVSIKDVFSRSDLATPLQFDEWRKSWQVAAQNGSTDSLLAFFSRERGLSEEQFIQRLGDALGYPPSQVEDQLHSLDDLAADPRIGEVAPDEVDPTSLVDEVPLGTRREVVHHPDLVTRPPPAGPPRATR